MNIESISSENINKELAYLFGVYLTDGCLSKRKECNTYKFSFASIDKEFSELVLSCIKKIIPNCNSNVIIERSRDRYWPNGKISKCQLQYRVTASFGELSNFFLEQTGFKKHIPFIIWEAPLCIKKWFIAGIMDGDGWISKKKRDYGDFYQYQIGVCKTDGSWIYEFKELLEKIGVKTLKIQRLFKEGNDYRKKIVISFGIKVSSFVDNGLFFTIKRKQDRLKSYVYRRSETKHHTSYGMKK